MRNPAEIALERPEFTYEPAEDAELDDGYVFEVAWESLETVIA